MTPGKAGQDATWQSLQWHHFACDVIHKQKVGYDQKERTETSYSTAVYGKIHAGFSIA